MRLSNQQNNVYTTVCIHNLSILYQAMVLIASIIKVSIDPPAPSKIPSERVLISLFFRFPHNGGRDERTTCHVCFAPVPQCVA